MMNTPPPVHKLALSYINPAEHPFYIIISLGTTTLSIIANCKDVNGTTWFKILIPITLLIFISLYFSFNINRHTNALAYEFQMKLTRTIGIIAPLICFMLPSTEVLENDYFIPAYFCCNIQMFLFLIYAIIPLKRGEEHRSKYFNFIQLSMITTVLIFDITYSCAVLVDANETTNETTYDKNIMLITIYIFAWLICIIKWIEQLYTNYTITKKTDINNNWQV